MGLKSVRTKGKGGVFTPQQLTKDLQGLADEIKEYMFTKLQATSKHKLLKSGGIIEDTKVEITADGISINTPDYAQYIDSGRKAFTKKVPIDAIIKWIRRYRIGGRDTKGKFVKRSDNSVNSLAFAIQTSIYKNGIKARHYLEDTINFGMDLIGQYIEETLLPDLVTQIAFTITKKN